MFEVIEYELYYLVIAHLIMITYHPRIFQI